MSGGVVKLIEQRKKANAYYDSMNASIADRKRVQQIATFEINTTKRIERNMKNKRFEELRREQEASLLMRRHQLADLYNSEIQSWRDEVLAKAETQESRKANIMERAYALRDKRESARAEIVKDALDRQWRDSCDDARLLDSKAMLQFVKNERLAQIQEKVRRKERLSLQENDFYAAWQQHLAEYDRKEEEKLRKREMDQHNTLVSIRSQIDDTEQRKRAQREQRLVEETEEIENIQRDIALEEAIQRQRQLDAVQRGKEVQRLNAQMKAVRLEEKRMERMQDNYLLDYAIAQEKKAEAEEEAKRRANKEAAQKFKKFLEMQMVKEAEDTAFVDEMRQREEEKLHKARDEALAERERARQQLMRQVDEGRQQQIAAKERELAAQKIEDDAWAKKFLEDAEIGKQKERAAMEARRKIAESNNQKLLDQIQMRKELEEKEKQEIYLGDKHMQYIERQHRAKLAEQGGTVRGFRPLKKSQWYS